MRKTRHEIRCVKGHLKRYGEYLLNEKSDASEFLKGRGDGLLRALDILSGDITGDSTVLHMDKCLCRKKKVAKYDHYENL